MEDILLLLARELVGVEVVVPPVGADELDRFDRVQLADVLTVCSRCHTLSEAGRMLFAASRENKRNPNDADRVRKYLLRFGLSWQDIQGSLT